MHPLTIGRTYTYKPNGRAYTYAGLKWDYFNQRQYHGFRNDQGDLVPMFSDDIEDLEVRS